MLFVCVFVVFVLLALLFALCFRLVRFFIVVVSSCSVPLFYFVACVCCFVVLFVSAPTMFPNVRGGKGRRGERERRGRRDKGKGKKEKGGGGKKGKRGKEKGGN